MCKEILTFGDTDIEKNKFSWNKSLLKFLKSLLYVTRFLLVKRTISTSLVTCIMIIKLNIKSNASENKRLCKKS